MAPATTIQCQQCGESRDAKTRADGGVKLPPKWRRIGERTLCGKCAGVQYVSRSLTLPIGECVSHPWPEFAQAAHQAFARSTAVAREAIRQYAMSDPQTPPGQKIGKWTPPNAYQACRQIAPELAAGTVAAVCQRLQGVYREQRLALHRGERVLPGVRYPQPVPIRAQDYTLAVQDDVLVITFRLESTAVVGSQRYTLKLREKGGFERNGRLLRRLMEGGGVIGEVTLDAIRTNGTSRDHPHEQRDAGGGNRAAWKYVLRFAVKIPAAQRDKTDEGILLVRTTEDSLLVWQLAGQEERPPLHAEHVRRQLVRFGREQARLRDDLKLEKRWPSRVRQKMVSRQNDLAAKRSRMLRTFCQQAAAMTVAFARRRKCGTIQYDDTVRTFAASFPWHQLRDAIAAKCQAEGVILVDANPKPTENAGQVCE